MRLLLLLILCSILNGQTLQNRPYNLMNLQDLPIRYTKVSARSLGMGGAAIAIAGEPTLISTNPAGLALFSFPAASLGQSFSREKTTIHHQTCEAGFAFDEHVETGTEQTLVNVIVPTKRLKFAVFRETVMDLRLNFDNANVLRFDQGQAERNPFMTNSPGRRNATSFQIIESAFAFGFTAFKNVYAGASFRLLEIDFRLLEQDYFAHDISTNPGVTCLQNSFAPENLYLQRSVDEKRWLVGGNAGALWRVNKNFSLGAYFTHRPGATVSTRIFLPAYHFISNGDVSFPALADSVFWTLDLPDDFGAGLAWQRPNRFNLTFDLVRIFYSDFADGVSKSTRGDLRNRIQDDADAGVSSENESPDLDLRDQWQFRFGGEYISAKARKLLFLPYEIQSLHLRAGYYNEPPARLGSTASFDDDFLRLDQHVHVFTAGFGVVFRSQGSGFRLDAAASYSSRAFQVLISGVISIF